MSFLIGVIWGLSIVGALFIGLMIGLEAGYRMN
jgi:hypothetical protein